MLLHFRCAKAKPADFLRAWVDHLLAEAVAAGGGGTAAATVLVTTEAGYRFRPVSGAAARLEQLARWA
ncbi:MAG: hypothetical protein ACKPAD_08170, partial [Bacteroidota bacterium]